jgi:hypothetical protein
MDTHFQAADPAPRTSQDFLALEALYATTSPWMWC